MMQVLSKQVMFTVLLVFMISVTFAQTPDYIPENMCGFEPSVPYYDPYAHSPSGQEICTDPSAVKYVRLAFHFLLPGGSLLFSFENDCANPNTTVNYYGAGNFTEYGDGWNDYEYTGYDFADDLVRNANFEFANPEVQWRKDPSSTYPDPANPTNIQYVLAGVYFHRDADAYYNVGTKSERLAIHNQYGVESNEIINMYLTPILPHSGVANTAVGGTNKYIFLNMYHVYRKDGCQNWVITSYGPALINHEVGHTISLRHTWSGPDNCDDTPEGFIYDHEEVKPGECPGPATCCQKKANCGSFNENIPGCPLKPCDEWSKISNNGMDYNGKFPHAYTNCQIDRMNADLTGQGNAFVYSCTGCLPTQAFFDIRNPFYCSGEANVVMDANGTFNADKYRFEICEVQSESETCISTLYNSGWLTGDPSYVELSSYYSFEEDKYYRITLYADNTGCPLVHDYSKTIFVKACFKGTPSISVEAMSPVGQTLYFDFTISKSGTLEIFMINVLTGHSTVVFPLQSAIEGTWSHGRDVSFLPDGLYYLAAVFDNELASELLVKL